MAKVVTDDSHYKAIADTIRENAPIEQSMTPAEMPDHIVAACEYNHGEGYSSGFEDGAGEGYADGYADGYEDGSAGGYTEEDIAAAIEQGKQAEYDRFWDAYQQNGNVADARALFSGEGWTVETLRPKYDMRPTNAQSMFWKCGFVGDLQQRFDELGVVLDTSKATRLTQLFSDAYYITRVGVIDATSAPTMASTLFAYCWELVTIDKLKVAPGHVWTSTFAQNHKLENLIVEGVIDVGGMNLQWSTKLSKASITSVVNALSSTTSGLSVTLSKTAVNNAFTTDEWNALAGTKTNWTINLV